MVGGGRRGGGGGGGPCTTTHPSILQNCVIDNIAHEKQEPSLLNLSNSEILGENGITKISRNFKPHTSMGIVNIPLKLLKMSAEIIVKPQLQI